MNAMVTLMEWLGFTNAITIEVSVCIDIHADTVVDAEVGQYV